MMSSLSYPSDRYCCSARFYVLRCVNYYHPCQRCFYQFFSSQELYKLDNEEIGNEEEEEEEEEDWTDPEDSEEEGGELERMEDNTDASKNNIIEDDDEDDELLEPTQPVSCGKKFLPHYNFFLKFSLIKKRKLIRVLINCS